MSVVENAPERIAAMAALTDAALAGRVIGVPAFDALRVVAAETRLPPRFAHDLIQGFRLDGDGWRPRTEDDLLRYCYHVAGVVGCMMAVIMGVSPRFAHDLIQGFRLDGDGWRPRTEDDLLRYCYHVAGVVGCMMAVIMGVSPDDDAVLDRACDLGLAFQLANIARDIDEDAQAGRCYLPTGWLGEMGIAPDAVMAAEHRPALAILARRLTDRAAQFEASARMGTRALSFRSAWAVLAAAQIYGAIGRKVAARGERAWDARVTTSKGEKLRFIARAAVEARGRMALVEVPRDPSLWRRPRS